MVIRDVCVIALTAAAVLSACSEPTGSDKAGPPATVSFVSGDNQSALAGTVVPTPPVAQVRDSKGRGVPGVGVVFSIFEGGGSVASTAPVNTDASGNATAPAWTLGKSVVPQGLRATVTTTGTSTISATANASILTNYNIDIRFFGGTTANTSSFGIAASRIRAAVTGELPDVPAENTPRDLSSPVDTIGCGVAGLPTAFKEVVDDVIIFATVTPIDGPGKVLGSAFPCFIRDETPNNQTVIGIMRFDSDDISNPKFTDVVTHEMLHVVGIGTLWGFYGLRQGAQTPQTRYTGALGVGGCVAVGGASVCPGSIPLEALSETVGPGTADSHWSDGVFNNELMTGFVNSSTNNPFSVMSIQSLGDLKYGVNPAAADPYTVPAAAGSLILGQRNVDDQQTRWEQVQQPRFMISRKGKVRPMARPNAPVF